MSQREFWVAMSPSKNNNSGFPESREAIIDRFPLIDAHNAEIILDDRHASLTIYLRHIPRNERGILLAEVIEDGWIIDHIDLDNEHARAFKLKD